MKRFAAHYIFIPESGFLKLHAIEMEGEYVYRIFPCSEEFESVEWFPGVILLIPQEKMDINNTLFNLTNTDEQSITIPEITLCMKWQAYLLFPLILLQCGLSPKLSADNCGSNGYIQ